MRAILTYHSLDESGSCISVPPARFRRQMHWLRSEGVQVVSPEELLALPDSASAAAITFDDGISNLVTEGLPVLEEFGWTATVFVVTRFVGRSNRFRGGSRPDVPNLPLLDWDDLAGLQSRGWTIGSHSRHHPRLANLGDAELDLELEGAAEDLQARLGTAPQWFAYPYGSVDRRVADRASRTYRAACTTALYPLGASDAPMRLPRLDAIYLTGPLRLTGWGAGLRQQLRARRMLRAVREALA